MSNPWCDMKALLSRYKGIKYLQITRSEKINLEDIKASRGKILPLFQHLGIEKVVSDYRDVDFDPTVAVDIYMLVKAFKDDFPQCKQVALLCGTAPANLQQHFRKASEYYDIELQVHSDLDEAKDWICSV